MTTAKFDALFESPPRRPEAAIKQHHLDMAASIQAVTNEVMLRLTRALAKETGLQNLCLAGGVALNCVANGLIQRDGAFKRVWIQPAAGDAGGALGAAYAAHVLLAGGKRVRSGARDEMFGAYLGPSYGQDEIEERLAACGAVFTICSDVELIEAAVDSLVAGDALGWCQGRMEFGPRALGARSILGDPRRSDMQRNLNLKIKFRESFRPFAPSVLAEDAEAYFELGGDISPYMLITTGVAKARQRGMSDDEASYFGIEKLNVARSDIPAVTHVDYSARVQTVHRDTNPRYHALLSAFKARTGCAVLVNTSFNVRGEPIVNTPEDAFRCFMGCGIETLIFGNCVLRKRDQKTSLATDVRSQYAPD